MRFFLMMSVLQLPVFLSYPPHFTRLRRDIIARPNKAKGESYMSVNEGHIFEKIVGTAISILIALIFYAASTDTLFLRIVFVAVGIFWYAIDFYLATRLDLKIMIFDITPPPTTFELIAIGFLGPFSLIFSSFRKLIF